MNIPPTIFSQIMDFLPLHEFRKCVRRYRGDLKVKSFSCLDQFLCLAFAQLTYRESLRDIESCLRAMKSRLYHMGFRGRISRNTLAHANETRDWRIYVDFLRPDPHRSSPHSLRRRRPGIRTRQHGLCFRFDHHRLVSVSFPLGCFPPHQSGHQTPYPSRSARLDTLFYQDYRWKNARYKGSGRSHPRARRARCGRFRGGWLRSADAGPGGSVLQGFLTTSERESMRWLARERWDIVAVPAP